MKKKMSALAAGLLLLTVGALGQAQTQSGTSGSTSGSATAPEKAAKSIGLYPYPEKKQTAAQQNKDEKACYSSAKEQTGVDPTMRAAAPPASPPKGRDTARGAARGAAGGAAIGAIAGDPATGAAVGAAAGGVQGRRKAKEGEAASQQQAAQADTQQLDSFRRAFSSCMEARGYAVK